MATHIEETAKDFSKFVETNMNERLQPINKLIDDMQARLEEFQTMLHFAKQERVNAINMLTAICNNQQELSDLFQRIDGVESLVEHVKCSLNALEKDIEKAEEEVGVTDSTTTKVASILTPLFKKSTETSPSSSNLPIYKTSDYFHSDDESNPSGS